MFLKPYLIPGRAVENEKLLLYSEKQSNLFNTDTEAAELGVHIMEVSV